MDKICETHGRLRCSECNYVGELEERVNTLNKVIDELKLDEERLTDKYKSKDGENYLLRRRVQELEKENAHWYLEMTYFLNKSYFENPNEEQNQYWVNNFGYPAKQYWFRAAWILFLNIGINGFNFTLEQVEQAYLDKNKVNHERQANGY
ncbi:dUTP diphosphatase [Virgibacillus salarius]